ncbi:MAG TPA: iron ABC transporter permease [Candidatus Faecousia intestinigallinarum]|nr:iron ABC transporter permease [Candidatus Faecousia intestinigallinarum]
MSRQTHIGENKIHTTLRFGNKSRFMAVLGLLIGLLILGLVLNVNIGSVSIHAGDVFRMIGDGMRYSIANVITGGKYHEVLQETIHASTESQILFSIRIPRMLLSIVLGGALSISGYLLQVFFRNPIAGPFELGISSGAKMVVGITLIFLTKYIGNIGAMTLIGAAFFGSLLITGIVLLFSQKVNNMSMLLVIGIMVGYVCSAVTDFCVTFADDHDIVNLTNWSMGSFSGANWEQVKTASIMCLLGLLAACLLSKPMGAYALGEGYAKSMGINVKLFRLLLILLSSILSACVTAFAGPISFVGIAVPHITRTLMKTSKPIYMIPTTFLCGSVFCVFCDLIARTILAPTELKIGTVTAVFGAPVVIYMMVKRKQLQEV